MMKAILTLLVSLMVCWGCSAEKQSSFPPSDLIVAVEFDHDSIQELAPGSDNWAITWAANDEQYTTWGDGGGFGGDNKLGRVSMGVAKIVGTPEQFDAINVWGGHNALAEASFPGKSYGLLAIENELWMWRTGNASDGSAFKLQELYVSRDLAKSWDFTGVKFTTEVFGQSNPFFAPTFLQFGPGYSGALDDYVYIYAPDVTLDQWEVQIPGSISLMRVLKTKLSQQEAYEYFAGFDEKGLPKWDDAPEMREPVFSDKHGVMRTSVTYNAGLKRFLLTTQQVSRYPDDGHIGVYESINPWGPWKTVLFDNAWDLGLQSGRKNVYWNFSNKWTSLDGLSFTMVYTGPGPDNFGLINGKFVVQE